jgi:transcriptional regulator with PAS, ATPase and Fis domain
LPERPFVPSSAPDPPGRRSRWPALFDRSVRPVFVLNQARRLRYVNPAWEALAGVAKADAYGLACVRRGPTDSLARALAPPAAAAEQVATTRRPAPGAHAGPPWWDVTFVPLSADDGTTGYLGLVTVVAADPAVPRVKLPASLAALRAEHAAAFPPDLFAGTGPAADRFAAQLRAAAAGSAPVWLVGEPGCGKETAARVIHHASAVKERAFFGLDCSGIQPYLVEGLLAGKGGLAEAKAIGTIYLKQPAALPRDAQKQLLGWMTGPKPGPRWLAGSVRPAATCLADGTLLPDLYAALAVVEIAVPPLRERAADLPRIADEVLGRLGDPRPVLSAGVTNLMKAFQWPGNVRELADVLTAAAAKAGGSILVPEHVPRYVREAAGINLDPSPMATTGPNLDAVLEGVEMRLLALAMAKAHGNATRAAEWLGIPRTRLLRRAAALGLKPAGNNE